MKPLTPKEVFQQALPPLTPEQIEQINRCLMKIARAFKTARLSMGAIAGIDIRQVQQAYQPMGWDVSLNSDQREGDYWSFKPVESGGVDMRNS